MLSRRRGSGYLPDTADDRDILLGDRFGSIDLPRAVNLRSGLVLVKDQRGTNSCVGQSVSSAMRETLLRNGVQCPDLSALFAYLMSRAEHGGQSRDVGTHVRMCVRAVQRVGCASEALHKFSSFRVNRGPTPDAIRDAFARRGLRGYYRVSNGDTHGMRQALARGFCVVAGWSFDESVLDYSSGLMPDGYGDVNHAVYLDGYDGDEFHGTNSWGTGWGLMGHFVTGESLAAKARDAWAIDCTL